MINYKINKLNIFKDERGFVKHGLKFNNNDCFGIREVYFSNVVYGAYKGWKKHHKMVLNLIVIEGEILFYIANNDFSEFKDITLSSDDSYRLTIMPNQWVAFTSLIKPSSTIINIANLTNTEDITDSTPFFNPT